MLFGEIDYDLADKHLEALYATACHLQSLAGLTANVVPKELRARIQELARFAGHASREAANVRLKMHGEVDGAEAVQ